MLAVLAFKERALRIEAEQQALAATAHAHKTDQTAMEMAKQIKKLWAQHEELKAKYKALQARLKQWEGGSDSAARAPQYPSTGIEFGDPLQVKPVPVPALTAAERTRAISAARSYLYDDKPEPEGVEYDVSRNGNEYSVFVQTSPSPGGHCLILMSQDWKIVRVIPGA